MSILAAVFISLALMLGVLVLPYSLPGALVLFVLGVGSLALIGWRARGRFRPVLIGTAVLCLALFLVWNLALMPYVSQEVVTELETLSAEGEAGRALIVYHPGRSDLQEQAMQGFADGLLDSGWGVDRVTASREAPTDIAAYDLLVVGAQSYTWAPALPVQDYLRRVGDLDGLPVVAVLSGLGETGPATDVMRELIAEVNGTEVAIHHVWQLRPMDDLYGVDDPYEAMRGVAQTLNAES